ncbi:MAG: hypothetical protein A2X64_08070 [Ignavibacteria bacterium GWF2_33_9]|nr:MAG: hypothetical protein A2X64_08070 [Ignavibacteria bacterium GWF2_33_9]
MSKIFIKSFDIIYISILLILFCSCENNQINISDNFYTVKYNEQFIQNKGYITSPNYTNYIGFLQYSQEPLELTKYVHEKKFKLFKNSKIEIQDIFTIRFNIKEWKIYNLFISVNEKNNACYFIWECTDKSNNNNLLDIHLNISTDTVYSNINKNQFKTIFPKFQGKVINGKVKEITLKNDYPIYEHLFYLDLKLISLEVGDYEYWRKCIDTLLYYDKYFNKQKQKKLDSITDWYEEKYENRERLKLKKQGN